MGNCKVLSPKDVVEQYPALTTSAAVLANWRSQKRGPRYYKSAKKVFYRASDVEQFIFRNPVLTLDSY